MKAKDLLETSTEKETHNKKALVIPTMKIFAEDSPLSAINENYYFAQNKPLKHTEFKFDQKHHEDVCKDRNMSALQSHFTYEHFTGSKRNIPSQPELIRLLTETELGTGQQRNGQGDTETDAFSHKKTQQMKKAVCDNCRMPAGKHKHWCVHYLQKQKTKIFYGDRAPIQRRKKRVSFGEVSFQENDTTDTTDCDEGSVKVATVKYRTPKMIRSSTTLDGLNLRSNRPDFTSLHRDVYIQALAEARARKVVKLKSAYDFSTQTTLPYLFSYFENQMRPTRGTKTGFDGMKHIFGEVKLDKYYERLTGKESKGFYTKP